MAGRTDQLLYHGTCLAYASLIYTAGIDLTAQRLGTDFGQGFYTTTQWEQALMWAGETARRYLHASGAVSRPAVVVFALSASDWQPLQGLGFPAWPYQSVAAAQFVRACRMSSTLPHKHDYVYGPLYRDPFTNPTPITGRDQLSAHTNNAAAVLHKHVIGVWQKGVSGGWSRVIP